MEGLKDDPEEKHDWDMVPVDFEKYVRFNNMGSPNILAYEHVPRLVDICQKIIDGELKRVIIMMPPRYFKSEIFSRLLPGAFLKAHPNKTVGLTSYSGSLAWNLSEDARDYFIMSGGEVSSTNNSKKQWRIKHDGKGEMWAEGVGGSIIGKGYHLGIIDDPQDPAHARSAVYQKRFKEWYPSKWYSRKEPEAAMVIIMQRLAGYDAINFLFENEEEAPENWHIVCCDEIKSSEPLWHGNGPRGLPVTCTVEPDVRQEGEYLAPTRFTKEEVDAIHRVDALTAKSQRQMRPTALSGDFWERGWFDVHKELPADAYNGGDDWDTAYTKSDLNAASARVRSYRGVAVKGDPRNFMIYIEDVDWDWLEFDALATWIRTSSGPAYIEDKASGKSLHQHLRKIGIKTALVPVTGGDKLARSAGVQPIVGQGRVSINEKVFARLLQGKHPKTQCNGRQGLLAITAEMLASDSGDLDVNDAFVQAINRHVTDNRSKPSYSNIPI